MRTSARFLFAFLSLVLLAAPAALSAEDLNSVLEKLNVSAAKFKSTSADFVFESTQTDPVPDTTIQKGNIYYERKGKSFQIAAHINNKVAPKMYVFSGGAFRLWEGGNLDQVTTFAKATRFESYLMLGFGASGLDLASKWNIKYDGNETVNGVNTAKLELVAKDPEVRKNVPKVIVWMDLDRAVSIKQYWDEGSGQSRTCTYTNIKMNQSLPGNAFTLPTDKKTQYISR